LAAMDIILSILNGKTLFMEKPYYLYGSYHVSNMYFRESYVIYSCTLGNNNVYDLVFIPILNN